jgi:hypothetical protein
MIPKSSRFYHIVRRLLDFLIENYSDLLSASMFLPVKCSSEKVKSHIYSSVGFSDAWSGDKL